MPEKTTDKAANATNKASDIRRTLADPTPLYFAAGVIDKIREVAPERIAAVKAADPKAMQQRMAQQAKQTQSRLSAALAEIDTDLKKLRDQAQHLALQGVGLAAEYAVKAREGYGELAERGRSAVQSRRAEKNGARHGGGTTLEETRERDEILVFEPEAEAEIEARAKEEERAGSRGRAAQGGAGKKAESGGARKTAARKTASREGAARKTTSRSASKTTEKTTEKPSSRTAPKQDKPQS
ncbi:MAG TPA: hypothetical protein VFY14_16300 [Streptomyces sp.]|nr:hypothetical protein [Streptomyces sp.]